MDQVHGLIASEIELGANVTDGKIKSMVSGSTLPEWCYVDNCITMMQWCYGTMDTLSLQKEEVNSFQCCHHKFPKHLFELTGTLDVITLTRELHSSAAKWKTLAIEKKAESEWCASIHFCDILTWCSLLGPPLLWYNWGVWCWNLDKIKISVQLYSHLMNIYSGTRWKDSHPQR